jgi:rhodanese-related sulfurtransferase
MTYQTMTPKEYQERRDRAEVLRLIDVREEWEHALVRVEGAELMPLSRMADWEGSLDPAEEIVFMCHHGLRSASVCAFLARKGFTKLHNLAGGIDRWSLEVDRSVPRY